MLKSKEALENLPGSSTDIEADNIIKRYSKRPKSLENWCLADYVSQLEIKHTDIKSTCTECESENYNETGVDQNEHDDTHLQDVNEVSGDTNGQNLLSNSLPGGRIELKGGFTIVQRKRKKVIRYVRFSQKVDSENFYRERLMLFTPWRKEESDLICGFGSFQAKYMSLKHFIEMKAREYEKNAEALDEAFEMAQNDENNFDNLAPGTEQINQDDVEAGNKDSECFIYFNPDRPETQRQSDIAQDLGLSVTSVDISTRKKTLPDLKYRELIKSLNVKQREFFTHVLQTVKINKDKLQVFLSGGAGVGKSVLVTALFEALQRCLTSDPGDDPENCKVLLCAPTGKAAFHISGVTLHSAFRIPASQGYSCTPLSSDILNTLRTKYRHLAVVMIDEVSMVGNNMLKLVNERLKQIKGSVLPFGGVHMIYIGDLFQLKPVMDG